MNKRIEEIPSLEFLAKLIEDDVCFYQLANSNKTKIFGYKKICLLEHLKNYIRSLVNSSNNLTDKFLQRAKYYNDKFNFNILYFQNVQDGINKEFYNLIMKDYDGKDLARHIYLRLGEELCYDPRMIAYNQNLNNEQIEKVHYAKTSSINKENNMVTCKSWAELYKAFLIKNNIEAKVIREKNHYYVVVEENGKEYKADATNSFLDNDDIYINDLTRIKLKIPTCGYFLPYDISKESHFKGAYELYEEYLKSYPVSKFVTTGDALVDMVLAKIEYLNTIIYNLPQIEAVAFLKQTCSKENKIFNKNEIKLIKLRLINVNKNNQYNTTIVISVFNNGDYIYRILNIPEGLIEVKKEFIDKLVNKNPDDLKRKM